ncbi:MAG: hypothetical protein IT318_25140 [Anaerolineales bacterium]|nr:hypothetical protein [Anaerolineales bacterium]
MSQVELAALIQEAAQNSVAAGAQSISLAVEEELPRGRVRLSLCAEGPGLRPASLAAPGRLRLKAAAQACGGHFQLASALVEGVWLAAEFQRNHEGCLPLGDLAGAWLALLAEHPAVHWQFHYRAGPCAFLFDDQDVKSELRDRPLAEPAVMAYLREVLAAGVRGVRAAQPASIEPRAVGEAGCQP